MPKTDQSKHKNQNKTVALFNVVSYTTEQYSQVMKEVKATGKLKDPAYINRVVSQQTDGC